MDIERNQNVLGKLDAVDREILNVLQEDCSLTINEIRDEVETRLRRKKILARSIPRTTVHAKIKRMEQLEVIKARRAIVADERVGKKVTAFAFVKYQAVRPDSKSSDEIAFESMINKLKIMPGVQEIHTIAGEYDMLVKIKGESIKDIADVILGKIRRLDGVTGSLTSFVLRKHMENTKIDI